MTCQLTLKGCIQHPFDQRRQNAVLAPKGIAIEKTGYRIRLKF